MQTQIDVDFLFQVGAILIYFWWFNSPWNSEINSWRSLMLTVCCWPIVKNHMVIVSTILRAWIPVSHLGCFSSKAVDSSAFCILHVGKVKHKATSHEWAPRARTRSRCRRGRRRSPRPARAWWRGRRWGWRWSPPSSTWTHISANISIQLMEKPPSNKLLSVSDENGHILSRGLLCGIVWGGN